MNFICYLEVIGAQTALKNSFRKLIVEHLPFLSSTKVANSSNCQHSGPRRSFYCAHSCTSSTPRRSSAHTRVNPHTAIKFLTCPTAFNTHGHLHAKRPNQCMMLARHLTRTEARATPAESFYQCRIRKVAQQANIPISLDSTPSAHQRRKVSCRLAHRARRLVRIGS